MNSNIGLPVLIGAVVLTAAIAGGVAYYIGSQGNSAPAVAAAPAPAPAPAPLPAGAANDPNVPRVIVLDRNLILRESAAGKAMMADVQALGNAADREFQARANTLQQDAVDLQQQLAILAPDIREQRQQEFQNRQTQLQNQVQNRQTQIQNGMAIAGQKLDQALAPILQQLMAERGANMMLDRNAVILSSIDVDVTADAIQRLDEILPTLDVELSAQPPAPPTAPEVAAAAAVPE